MARCTVEIGQTARFGTFTALVDRLAGPDAPQGAAIAALVDRLADLIDVGNVVRGVKSAGRCDLDLTPDAAAWLADARAVMSTLGGSALTGAANVFAPPPPLGGN